MKSKETGLKYILLALLAFSGLGIDLLYAFLIEPLLYGSQMQSWTIVQYISHWTITSITWGIIAFLLVRFAKNNMGFFIFVKGEKIEIWQWVVIVCSVVFLLIVSLIDWNGLKIIKEFHSYGLWKFIFQYIYYAFETMLFTLIIVFGQKAFERWTKKTNVPFGGILCAITWGLVHILTKGSVSTGLLSALTGFIFGTIYLLVNRDIKKTYLILFIVFII